MVHFDVQDVDVTESESRDLKFFTFENRPLKLMFESKERPSSLTLTVTDSNNQTDIIVDTATFPSTSPFPVITEVQDGSRFIYTFTIPVNILQAGASLRRYTAVWTCEKSAISGSQDETQVIEVAPYKALQYIPGLRMFIDRSVKQRSAPQHYEDAEIFDSLVQGLRIVNSIHPANLGWQITTVNPRMEPYWLMASALWMLTSQHLLEVDFNFDFSGQEVTLNYDRTAGIESAIGRFENFLEKCKQQKLHLYRSSTSVGVNAVRPTRRGGGNMVMRTNSSNNGTFAMLNGLGLLL